MKQVQKQFTDFSQSVVFKPPTRGQAAANSGKNDSKQPIIDIQRRIENIWIKSERVNTEMIRTFSQLLGK